MMDEYLLNGMIRMDETVISDKPADMEEHNKRLRDGNWTAEDMLIELGRNFGEIF